jgi:hypothetical protein
VPIPEVATPFDQRAGVSPGLDVKLGPGRQGRVEFAMRRLVKAQPKNAQDFTGRFESKKRTATKPNLLDPDSNFI